MNREYTASVYLIESQKVLLIYHQKLQKWLPPGGHVEPNETPSEAAKREVFEETGLEFEFISQENLLIDCWNAKSIERPFLCLLENIPPYQGKEAHQHVDFIFVGRPVENSPSHSFAYKWFDLNELQQLLPDIEIFNETLQTVKHLFHVLVSVNMESRACSTSSDRTF